MRITPCVIVCILLGATTACVSDVRIEEQTTAVMCGNGVVDAGEACDGVDLRGRSCAVELPGTTGQLTCLANCSNFAFAGCGGAYVSDARVLIQHCFNRAFAVCARATTDCASSGGGLEDISQGCWDEADRCFLDAGDNEPAIGACFDALYACGGVSPEAFTYANYDECVEDWLWPCFLRPLANYSPPVDPALAAKCVGDTATVPCEAVRSICESASPLTVEGCLSERPGVYEGEITGSESDMEGFRVDRYCVWLAAGETLHVAVDPYPGPTGLADPVSLIASPSGVTFNDDANSSTVASQQSHYNFSPKPALFVVGAGTLNGFDRGRYTVRIGVDALPALSVSCAPEATLACDNGNVYWLDSCGTRGALKEDCCNRGCLGGACVASSVTSFACDSGDIYWFNECGARADLKESCCGQGCTASTCSAPNPMAQAGCVNGDVFWLDSCGRVGALERDCGNLGCASGECVSHGCSDGTVEGGNAYFGRDDIVLCASASGDTPAYVDSPGLCGSGWHLCTASDFVSRNQACAIAPAFWARVDDGDNCVAVHEATTPFNCSSDEVRAGVAGTCTGAASATSFGRQQANGIGTQPCGGWGTCGVLCCQ